MSDSALATSAATRTPMPGGTSAPALDGRGLVELLDQHRADLRRLGVERIGVFGSRARGEARPGSDVDVLVKFKAGEKTYDHYLDVKETLERLLGLPVDLVLEEALKPALRRAVLAETVYAAA